MGDPVPAMLALLRSDDEHDREAVLAHLRTDQGLLERVHALARLQGVVPSPVADLVLEQHGPRLVASYRACSDVEAGAWILCQLGRPGIDHAAEGGGRLDALAARLDAAGDPGAVARALGQEFGFAGDSGDYDAPDNSFLDRVLERRLGLPIALTVLWLLCCRRRGLEARALAIPGHVFGAWSGGWIDCFTGGRPVSRADLDATAQRAGAPDAGPWLAGASDRELLQRMALNLAVGYRRRGDTLRCTLAVAMAQR